MVDFGGSTEGTHAKRAVLKAPLLESDNELTSIFNNWRGLLGIDKAGQLVQFTARWQILLGPNKSDPNLGC